jgi:hypothetical protein
MKPRFFTPIMLTIALAVLVLGTAGCSSATHSSSQAISTPAPSPTTFNIGDGGKASVISDFSDKKGEGPSLNRGEKIALVNGEVVLDASRLNGTTASFFNTELPDGKTLYFFVVKDKNGIYHAAANACQVCFPAKLGFRQEGDSMVCNVCGNKYPLEKVATEKGSCNPAPINPNLEVKEGKLVIRQAELDKVTEFFS